VKPAAPVTLSQFHEKQGAVIFRGPVDVFNAAHRNIDHHDASGAKDGQHAAITQTNIAITMPAIVSEEGTFEFTPLFNHARKISGALGVKSRIESQRNAQGCGGRAQVGLRRGKHGAIGEKLVDRDAVPAKNIRRIQMIDHCQGIEFMQPWHDISILDVGQAADVQDKFGAAALVSNLVAGAFNISISQAQVLAGASQTKTG